MNQSWSHRNAVLVVGLGGCGWFADAPSGPEWGGNLVQCNESDVDDAGCFFQVPGGRVTLGAQREDPSAPGYDPAAQPTEGPVRVQEVASFWIQRGEMPTSLSRRLARSTARSCPDVGDHPASTEWVVPLPITSVDWHAAAACCEEMGGRLPTEAEWSLAARGPEGRRWSWGDTPRCPAPGGDGPDAGCSRLGPVPGKSADHEHPLHMWAFTGNVAEWTADAWIDGGGPGSGEGKDGDLRVVRGGSFVDRDPLDLRAAVRYGAPATMKAPDVGFRCVTR